MDHKRKKEEGRSWARDALSRQSCGRGVVVLADPPAVAVAAAAVAAEEQLVLVTLQEVGRELRIA
jgi:hypothetical protein